MANPQKLLWTAPTQYTDGTPFGQADHGGYEVEVNGTSQFAIPVAWHQDGVYEYPITELPGRVQGTNSARMRTVAANGEVSDWTGVITFPYLSRPLPPTSLAAV